ncbi:MULTISPECIES: ABC transporter permease [unclassified Mycoplasma]|uniref:ABC transporter permease subunit n=1 Tax=unclassified Mycoplasma TaxID=2683645 RepID=UPI000FDEA03C
MKTKSEQTSKRWPWHLQLIRLINSDGSRSAWSKVRASLIAILIGLAIGLLPILLAGGDPWVGYYRMFTAPFHAINFNKTMVTISIFILLGTGIGISFKTGLFNIGATGQFLMSGAICVLVGIHLDLPKAAALPLLILLSSGVGMVCALVPAALKAFFNVHEVVSTILLNWVFFFIVKWIVALPQYQDVSGSTIAIHPSMGFTTRRDSWDFLIILGLAILLSLMVFLVFRYTTFGYQLRANGLSPTAARYAGINAKMMIIWAMVLSGALAGLAGFLNYCTLEGRIPRMGHVLPTIAFEAITVTLLAFSSPLGSILAGLFYGTLYSGQAFVTQAGGNVVRETAQLSLAIIIFTAALASSFTRFNIGQILVRQIRLGRSDWVKRQRQIYYQKRAQIKSIYHTRAQLLRDQIRLNKQKLVALQRQWSAEVVQVESLFKKDQIDLATKNARLNQINQLYQSKTEHLIGSNSDQLRREYRIEIKDLKGQHRFEVLTRLDKYETLCQQLVWQYRHALAHADDLEERVKIKQRFFEEKTKLYDWWIGAVN